MLVNLDLIDICPKCKRVTDFVSNPEYFHKCEHCGHECHARDLIDGVDLDKCNEIIKEVNKYKKRFAHVKKGRMIRKPKGT